MYVNMYYTEDILFARR